MRVKRSLIVAIAALAVMGTNSVQAATSKPAANPYGASTIDPPAPGATVLILSKGGVVKKYSLAQIEAMGTKTITIFEPFVKKTQTFNVIALSDLFKIVGIKSSDKVVTSALNDYAYTNTAANFVAANGYLAVKRDGKDIPYDQGGPDRIIFPNTSKWAKFLDPWNWSLSSIAVK